MTTTLLYQPGELVFAKSGKVYRINRHRDPARYSATDWTYDAVQIRNGKPYGPCRVMTDKSFRGKVATYFDR